ncbi:MAG: hypothetical protein R3A10_05475 [Caldilineaceae bacterium]
MALAADGSLGAAHHRAQVHRVEPPPGRRRHALAKDRRAQAALAQAVDVADAIHCRPVAWHARRPCRRLPCAGRCAQHRHHRGAAVADVRAMAADIADGTLRATFLAMVSHRHLPLPDDLDQPMAS